MLSLVIVTFCTYSYSIKHILWQSRSPGFMYFLPPNQIIILIIIINTEIAAFFLVRILESCQQSLGVPSVSELYRNMTYRYQGIYLCSKCFRGLHINSFGHFRWLNICGGSAFMLSLKRAAIKSSLGKWCKFLFSQLTHPVDQNKLSSLICATGR